MRRIIFRVIWGISVYVALLGLTGCSDDRPTVQDIQSEFESLGFHFRVWDLPNNTAGIIFGCDERPTSLIGTDGVNAGFGSRLDIDLDIEDCDSLIDRIIERQGIEGADRDSVSLSFNDIALIEGADWDSVSLSFDDSLAAWRNPPDYAKRRVEYIIALISLLIPDMKNEVQQWIANSLADHQAHIRRFGKVTVEVKVESSDEWRITFRPDKD